MKTFESHIIRYNTTIREALTILNNIQDTNLILFVKDAAGKMIGTITDGDIRRFLIGGKSVDEEVTAGMYSDFRFIRQGNFTLEEFKKYKNQGITLLPVLDDSNGIVDVKDLTSLKSLLPVDVVIMAGGEGQRLRPLTENTPKPLLPVGGKPILEHNIDRLASYGVHRIYITLRYLGNQIADYFGTGKEKSLAIQYVTEKEKLGTIGAIGLIEAFTNEAVLVMNSDLLTNIDYEDFYTMFVESGADMLIAAVPYEVKVPYAVLETTNGRVHNFAEKPTYTYHSNAGIYLIKKACLSRINGETHYDATDFMQSLIEEGKNVQTYPLLQYWLDIGKHDDYQKAQEAVKHMSL